jgi:hypothetical protein
LDEPVRHRLREDRVEGRAQERSIGLVAADPGGEPRIRGDPSGECRGGLGRQGVVGEGHEHPSSGSVPSVGVGFGVSASRDIDRALLFVQHELVQPRAGPREPAHHRADRQLEHLGGFPVGQPLDADRDQHEPLFGRQALERLARAAHRDSRLAGRASVAAREIERLLDRHLPAARPALPAAIEPAVLQDPEQPAVEAGPGGELIGTGECPLAGLSDEVVGLLDRAAEGPGEAAQARQQRDELLGEGRIQVNLRSIPVRHGRERSTRPLVPAGPVPAVPGPPRKG